MDGLVTQRFGNFQDIKQSRIMRDKWIRVNTDVPGADDVSGFAALDPVFGAFPAGSENQRGPHFILSPETPDGRPTLGFQWCIVQNPAFISTPMTTFAGGTLFTVTVWRLLTNLQFPSNQVGGVAATAGLPYASFLPVAGVLQNQLFNTFDVNACAIRFQIVPPAGVGSVTIAICEI